MIDAEAMGKISFQPLKSRRLSEIIEDSIRDLIISGELKTGQKLPAEKEISKQFSVSIVTVREALRGLEAFGFVQKRRGRGGGIFIARTNSKIVKSAINNFLTSKKFSGKHVGEVRRIIEPACVRIAASNITQEELAGLEENIKYCEGKLKKKEKTFSDKDFFEIEERNVEFHRLVAEATHNPVLSLTVDYVEDFLLSFKKSNLSPNIEFSRKTIKGHRAIYAALLKGDAKIAGQKMLRHCNFVEEYLINKALQPEK